MKGPDTEESLRPSMIVYHRGLTESLLVVGIVAVSLII